MSKRFMRWVENWIEEKIPAGVNPDLESHEARAARLTKELYDEATAAGFSKFEIDEDRERVPPLVIVAVTDSTEFDIDTYHLKLLRAMENEDGD